MRKCPKCGDDYREHITDQAECLYRQLAAANERANRYHRDAQKMSAALTAKMESTTGHSFGRTLANVGYHAERMRRIDTEAALREANERAGRLEGALRKLVNDCDQCPTYSTGGIGGQTMEACVSRMMIRGLPVPCIETAREALANPDPAGEGGE